MQRFDLMGLLAAVLFTVAIVGLSNVAERPSSGVHASARAMPASSTAPTGSAAR